MQNNAAALTKS